MNLRTHISRPNGYRELGMYYEFILELEAIDGDDQLAPLGRGSTLQHLPRCQGMGTGEDDGWSDGQSNARQV